MCSQTDNISMTFKNKNITNLELWFLNKLIGIIWKLHTSLVIFSPRRPRISRFFNATVLQQMCNLLHKIYHAHQIGHFKTICYEKSIVSRREQDISQICKILGQPSIPHVYLSWFQELSSTRCDLWPSFHGEGKMK